MAKISKLSDYKTYKFILFSLFIIHYSFLINVAEAQITPKNLTQLGVLTYQNDLSDVWGHVDTAGNEYALVGVRNGFSIVDVTDPASPTEIKFYPGASSTWRDIKTWKNYAYVTNESSGGLLIVNMNSLPDTTGLSATSYVANGLSSAHNLYIDENGICYLFGANTNNGGVIMLDVDANATNPPRVGTFENWYCHDGMVRNDTMYLAHINDGFLSIVSVSDPSTPQLLGTKTTPNNFAHNIWVNDKGDHVFTTDEVAGAFIGSYDISDPTNITEVDRIQSTPGANIIPHNTHVLNDWLITSYYTDGITIHDAARPHNLIEVGAFDTDLLLSGGTFDGSWGAYPYLPSGNILATDINNGLMVLGPTYLRGCYLEGEVTDATTMNTLQNVLVEIVNTSVSEMTNGIGEYAVGVADSGFYDVTYRKSGYVPHVERNVHLRNGVLVIKNIQLQTAQPFTLISKVIDKSTGQGIPNAKISIFNNLTTYNITANPTGNYAIPNFFPDTYDVSAASWGHKSACDQNVLINNSTAGQIVLDSGYYDDFTFDFSWQEMGTANTGKWVRDVPLGTTSNGDEANPGLDVQTDCSNQAFITGNNGAAGAGADDVDDGNTILTSPIFDLSKYKDPYLSYYRWFYNGGGNGNPDDTLTIKLTNGASTITLETITVASLNNSSWEFRNFQVNNLIGTSNSMQLILETADQANSGHLVEAGFDVFEVVDSGRVIINPGIKDLAFKGDLKIFPNPSKNKAIIEYDLKEKIGLDAQIEVFDVLGKQISEINIQSVSGNFILQEDLKAGIYFIRLRNNNQFKTIRFVKTQ